MHPKQMRFPLKKKVFRFNCGSLSKRVDEASFMSNEKILNQFCFAFVVSVGRRAHSILRPWWGGRPCAHRPCRSSWSPSWPWRRRHPSRRRPRWAPRRLSRRPCRRRRPSASPAAACTRCPWPARRSSSRSEPSSRWAAWAAKSGPSRQRPAWGQQTFTAPRGKICARALFRITA